MEPVARSAAAHAASVAATSPSHRRRPSPHATTTHSGAETARGPCVHRQTRPDPCSCAAGGERGGTALVQELRLRACAAARRRTRPAGLGRAAYLFVFVLFLLLLVLFMLCSVAVRMGTGVHGAPVHSALRWIAVCDGLRHFPSRSPSRSLLGDLSLRLDFPIALDQSSASIMPTTCGLGTC